MKLFKKFLLAAGLVGLVGLTGFASEAWAKTYYQEAIISTDISDDGELTWDIDVTDPPSGMKDEDEFIELDLDSITKATITINGKTKKVTPEDDDAPDDMSVGGVDISDYLNLDTPATASSPAYIGGTVKVKLTFEVDDKEKSYESPEDTSTLKYKQIITSSDFQKGYISADGVISELAPIYLYKAVNESIFIGAFSNDGYEFKGWSGSSTSTDSSTTVTAKPNATFKAEFGDKAVDPTAITLWAYIGTGAKHTTSITANVNDTVYLGVDLTPSGAKSEAGAYEWYIDGAKSSKAVNATANMKVDSSMAGRTIVVRVEYKGLSSQINVVVNNTSNKITTSDYVGYATNNYTIEFKASAENKSTDIKFAVKSDYKDYAEIKEITKNTSDGNVTVKINIKDKLEKGTNEKSIKLTATVDGVDATIDGDSKEKELTIYSIPSASFSSSDRTISYKAPKKVNTGTTDGQDSDNKDNTKTAISEVKGVKIQVFSGDTSLGSTSTAKEKGTGATIDATTVESIVNNLSSKLSGDSPSLKFRVFPCDSSAVYNKNVYADVTSTVYKVEVTYTKADGTTGTESWYGFEGQAIDFSKNSTLKSYTISDKDAKVVFQNGKMSDSSLKIKSSTADNKYTGVLSEKKEAADGTGLDKVPKTGQSNVFVYVMVAIVVCAVCGGLYAYNRKSKNL